MNEAQLIGHLGKDPETRSMQNGGKVCNLSVATSERWKDKQSGEQRERTEWHRIVIFNENLISVAERFLKKGSRLFIRDSVRVTLVLRPDRPADRQRHATPVPPAAGHAGLFRRAGGDAMTTEPAATEWPTEPWVVSGPGEPELGEIGMIFQEGEVDPILTVDQWNENDDTYVQSTARRVCACINALAGIADPAPIVPLLRRARGELADELESLIDNYRCYLGNGVRQTDAQVLADDDHEEIDDAVYDRMNRLHILLTEIDAAIGAPPAEGEAP